ncbi:MAG: hypothetical protein U1D55_12645 [Phycisphaerae bacterium]
MNRDAPQGLPDFEIAGFRVCVFGRQFEQAQDYWDGNWLLCTRAVQRGGR